jgi:exodeoxyribonuclease VII large subunit
VETTELPDKALGTTPEHPWPVRHLSRKIADYVAKMPPVWVEGQVLNLKRWNQMVFLTLRDTDVDMSLGVTLSTAMVDGTSTPIQEGSHVVVHARPEFWLKNGSLRMRGDELRPVGVGELLARIEHLRGLLAAEGLFDLDRKVPLPFLPMLVGLVCAQQGDAEHDVVTNARIRWPEVAFEIRRVTVQGARAVPEVGAAIAELDADPRVDVIVVARGGGSFEDLLPFSNETLVRAAAACRTPLVSAIGHEKDSPLLDLVADLRASTPTDAGKRIVPDVTEERARLAQARTRIRTAVTHLVERVHQRALARWRVSAGRALVAGLERADSDVVRLAAQVRALSPQATLDRGYAVVQLAGGTVVRAPDEVRQGDPLRVRLARGEFAATRIP